MCYHYTINTIDRCRSSAIAAASYRCDAGGIWAKEALLPVGILAVPNGVSFVKMLGGCGMTAGKERRIGVIGIVLEDRTKSAAKVNAILSAHGDDIVGRMGIPYREKNISVIALIVDGSTDEIGALTGKLGAIEGVMVKSALTSFSSPV